MRRSFFLAIGLVLVATLVVEAQPPQGRGQRKGGPRRGGFSGRMMGGGPRFSLDQLLRNDKVREELDLLDDQVDQLKKLGESMRSGRPDFSKFREMSQEEREKFMADMRKKMEKRAREAEAKIKDILLPEQWDRLQEIRIQASGTGALLMKEVQQKIKLSEEQVAKIRKTMEDSQREMMTKMREMFQGGNREGLREKIGEMRKEIEKKVLGDLTSDQREAFEKLKGEKIEIDLSRGFGRGGAGGRRGRPGGEGQRRGRPGGDK